ncbi:hypothetical protein [Rhodopseudomonas palustris]|uniref:Transmembrane protein n=1 Tax=Rhodopseudomonas palustris (strain BisB18) TaxID=316056 RepID=Q213G0_RHOPB
MNSWIAAFTAAVVFIIGFAAGPQWSIVFLAVLGLALFLLWANELGFRGALARLGLDRLKPPVWKRENWVDFQTALLDRDKLVKAYTVALALVALKLMLPANQGIVVLAALVLAGWYIFKIYEGNRYRDQADTAKFN